MPHASDQDSIFEVTDRQIDFLNEKEMLNRDPTSSNPKTLDFVLCFSLELF